MEVTNKSAEISWFDREIKRFKEVGKILPERQEKLYCKIRDEFVGGKTALDAGCSCGIGTNILSHEARFVWGIDINEEAIKYALQAFKRPNMDFAVLDLENPPTREFAKFEIVVASEVLEHLAKPEVGLATIKNFMQPKAIGFITCPNGANQEVRENEAKHGLHIQHWTAGDFYGLMTNHFSSVVMYSVDKLENWGANETVDGNTTDYLIVAKVEGPK